MVIYVMYPQHNMHKYITRIFFCHSDCQRSMIKNILISWTENFKLAKSMRWTPVEGRI